MGTPPYCYPIHSIFHHLGTMNPQESELEYVFGETLPATGKTLEVAPGVRWLRMGLPFALNHINLWLLEDVR